jgi:DNA repair exonuclease SbcCD ATPase subunit
MGLVGHLRLVHGVKTDPNAGPGAAPVSLNQTKIDERSETKMAEPGTYCPGCHEKERLLDKKDAVIEKTTQELTSYQQTIKALQDQLAAAQAAKPAMPSLQEVIQHCESGQCQEHAAEWETIKTKIGTETMKKITPAMVEEWATKLGMVKPHVITVGVKD